MFSFQELTKSLPPIRDDEPPSLRQEIADEIADHLLCGLRRELLINGGDESAARVRVLDKFGNPSQIVRQLWFQAMWSKIMSQRFMLFMGSFSMIVTTVLVALIGWMMVAQARESAANQMRLADAAASIARLTALIQKPNDTEPARDPNWNHLKIKVTLDEKNGPAAEGYTLNVARVPRIGETKANLQGRTITIGMTGVDDCGFVEAGLYQVSAIAPWGEGSTFSFTVLPGHDHEEHLVVPAEMPKVAKVTVKFGQIPEDIANCEVAVVISINPSPSRRIGDQDWFLTSGRWGVRNLPGQFLPPVPGSERIPSPIPALMYIPGRDFWICKGGIPARAFREQDFSEFFHKLKWEPFQQPLEFEVPEHDYSVEFNYVHLVQNVDPTSDEWVQSCVADLQIFPIGPNPNNGGWKGPIVTQTRHVAVDQLNEWTMAFPDTVITRMKTKIYSPRVETPEVPSESPGLNHDEKQLLKKLLEGQKIEKKVLQMLDVEEAK